MEDYEHIVCAVDFSPLSEAAAARAVRLARRFGSKLTFLHVVEYFPEDRSNEVIAPESIDPAEYRETQAREGLTELMGRLGCEEAEQQVVFTPHAAWYAIIGFAETSNADLIVLGSHGYHGAAALFGSSAKGVVNRAPCDVLAVRPS
jgi:universal stress protein A